MSDTFEEAEHTFVDPAHVEPECSVMLRGHPVALDEPPGDADREPAGG